MSVAQISLRNILKYQNEQILLFTLMVFLRLEAAFFTAFPTLSYFDLQYHEIIPCQGELR